jgi:membrane protein
MMINAYKNFFKGYVDFAGRSTRSEYWWVWLGNMILLIPFYSAYGNALANSRDEGALIALGGTVIIYMIIGLALFLPGLALTVRRLRDAGFHWALIFIIFVPLGSFVLLVLLAMPTKEAEVVTINEPQKVQVEEVIEASPFEGTDNK